MTTFVGVDGEGITFNEGEPQRYVMLASSLGNSVIDMDGLRTIDCFEFLFRTKAEAPRDSQLVGFAFNYDVNMILRDVGKAKLVRLWKNGKVVWRDYFIKWIPSKMFQITDRNTRRGVLVYDTFGFFQCSFAKALKGWDVPAPEQLDHMKASRSDFNESRVREILDYCHAECRALSVLMDRLKASMDSVNLKTSQWHGAGAVAAALLKREKVHKHVQPDENYGNMELAFRHAYFGGRTELFKQGRFDALYGFDIRSAYPAAAVTLPSLKDATFRHAGKSKPVSGEISLHKVKWSTDPDGYIQPFPFRDGRSIYYPPQGIGYYWSCEVEAALERFGDDIRILSSWKLVAPYGHIKPLAFVRDIYAERAKLKAAGHFGHQSYKLAINALYGKLAQGTTWNGRPPPFRTYIWAGIITAQTRARMLRMASPDVVMICTDGIYFDAPQPQLREQLSNDLGGLEESIYTDAFIAQPGIYEGTTPDGKVQRSRGVFAREIDFPALREGYDREGPYFTLHISSTRFVGIGTSIIRRSFDGWQKWLTEPRRIGLYPSRKFIRDDTERPVIHIAPTGFEGLTSDPYIPKRSGMDAPGMRDWVQSLEQPMREEVA